MRIGIDARFGFSGGVDRYIFELINHLVKIDLKNIYYIYVSPANYIEKFKVSNENFNFIPLKEAKYHPMATFILRATIKRDKIDIFHALSYGMIPLFPKCPLVVTVHDVFALCGWTHTLKGRIHGRIAHTLAVRSAIKVIAVSNFTRDQLSYYFPKYKDKMVVVYHGVGQEFRIKDNNDVDKFLKNYNLRKGFLLYVGNLKKHKNILNLLRAYSLLSTTIKKDHPLIIVGGKDDCILNVMESSNLSKEDVRFIEYTSDIDTLVDFYNGASALIMPSVVEYFGLPVVEAMACGIPVISSNAACLPEICGDAAIYFSPNSVDEIRKAIERILTEEGLRANLSISGLERSKRFSWDITAKKTLEIYEEVFSQR